MDLLVLYPASAYPAPVIRRIFVQFRFALRKLYIQPQGRIRMTALICKLHPYMSYIMRAEIEYGLSAFPKHDPFKTGGNSFRYSQGRLKRPCFFKKHFV